MRFWRLRFISLYGAVIMPVIDGSQWTIEKYSNIPANAVLYPKDGMLIKVDRSASPLIFRLTPPRKVTGFHIKGEFRGLPKFKDVKSQGEKGSDDYPLRIGFVIPGEKQLTGLKKILAPAWIKNLYSTAPPGSGVDHIEFFNVTQNQLQLGHHRIHPLSDLIRETFFSQVERAGIFDFDHRLTEAIEATAIWISIDGDDTKSTFDVLVRSLNLKIP
jgi:hypothetical protein